MHRYPCPAFSLPRPCWPKMIKCHQSPTPKRRATPSWPSGARQHPRPGPPPRGGGLVALYHFWSARSKGGGRGTRKVSNQMWRKSWWGGVCILPIKITNDKMPPATCSRDPHSRHLKFLREQKHATSPPGLCLLLHLKWVRNETTLIFIFIKSTGNNQLQQPPLKQTG